MAGREQCPGRRLALEEGLFEMPGVFLELVQGAKGVREPGSGLPDIGEVLLRLHTQPLQDRREVFLNRLNSRTSTVSYAESV